MTLNELVQYTKRRLVGVPGGEVWADREIEIAATIPAALQELGAQVLRDRHRRNLLQQSYSVALDSAGIGNLLTAIGGITGTAGEILQDGVALGVVRDAENNVLVWLPNYDDFLRPASIAFGYYTLVAARIYTRAVGVAVTPSLDIAPAATPLTVFSSYAPAAVSGVPKELEDDTISILTEILMRQVSPINQVGIRSGRSN
ncbi:MAG: hypothetical protein L0Y58_22400 [Verrucomicrobia subdivision 3 bacterium]|nr:hypothetical protein [Limisphaerales bacterium]